jgi:cytochrome P450
MRDYTTDLIDRRRRTGPRDDLLSELMRIEEEGDRLSHQELCDLTASLIMAGTDTTRNQLGLTLLVLAQHPDEWQRLVDDPGLAPRAVEEALRFEPTAATLSRLVTEDVSYRDVTLPAESTVWLVTAAANRDPEAVECPMRFDVGLDRGAWSPLTFGNGEHYCLGASLARAELQEALEVLARRWRRIELSGTP